MNGSDDEPCSSGSGALATANVLTSSPLELSLSAILGGATGSDPTREVLPTRLTDDSFCASELTVMKERTQKLLENSDHLFDLLKEFIQNSNGAMMTADYGDRADVDDSLLRPAPAVNLSTLERRMKNRMNALKRSGIPVFRPPTIPLAKTGPNILRRGAPIVNGHGVTSSPGLGIHLVSMQVKSRHGGTATADVLAAGLDGSEEEGEKEEEDEEQGEGDEDDGEPVAKLTNSCDKCGRRFSRLIHLIDHMKEEHEVPENDDEPLPVLAAESSTDEAEENSGDEEEERKEHKNDACTSKLARGSTGSVTSHLSPKRDELTEKEEKELFTGDPRIDPESFELLHPDIERPMNAVEIRRHIGRAALKLTNRSVTRTALRFRGSQWIHLLQDEQIDDALADLYRDGLLKVDEDRKLPSGVAYVRSDAKKYGFTTDSYKEFLAKHSLL